MDSYNGKEDICLTILKMLSFLIEQNLYRNDDM